MVKPLKFASFLALVICSLTLSHSLSQGQESIFGQLEPLPEEGTEALYLGPDSTARMQACQTLVDLDVALDNLVLSYEARYKNIERGDLALEEAVLDEAYGRGGLDVSPQGHVMLDDPANELVFCGSLDREIKTFILQHESKLVTAAQNFAGIPALNDESLSIKWVDILSRKRAPNAQRHAKAQEILYYCIARNKTLMGVIKPYSLERSMKKWFELQKPLIDAWLGNTD